ncbi:MAG: nucleotidyltransferase domain-containing protein [archaeon]
MDIYKLKFTRLQQEILRFLFINNGNSFNQRALSKNLGVSPTAIAKSAVLLEKMGFIEIKRDKESRTNCITLNYKNQRVFQLKRAENLKMIYESGLSDFLSEEFPGSTIILFGSYSKGEDTINSDVDISIIGTKEKLVNLGKFEELLKKKIILQFYPDFKGIHKNLKENIFNGIVLKGGVEL